MNAYELKKKAAISLFSIWIYRYLVIFIDKEQTEGL